MLGPTIKAAALAAALALGGELLLSPPLSCWVANVLAYRDPADANAVGLVLLQPGGGVGMMLRRFLERPADLPGSACRATLLALVTPR